LREGGYDGVYISDIGVVVVVVVVLVYGLGGRVQLEGLIRVGRRKRGIYV